MKTKKLLILNASPRKRGNIAQMVLQLINDSDFTPIFSKNDKSLS